MRFGECSYYAVNFLMRNDDGYTTGVQVAVRAQCDLSAIVFILPLPIWPGYVVDQRHSHVYAQHGTHNAAVVK